MRESPPVSSTVVPCSVVIPTIGRPARLGEALASLSSCRPAPAEVIVVDQSEGDETRKLVEGFADKDVRLVPSAGRGIGRALNAGLRAARHDLVLVTNDDCTAAPDWVGIADRELSRRPGGIVTGSVLPAGDAGQVPSLRESSAARDYTGTIECNALYGANMAASREALLQVGGFDELVRPSAEDNDLCYRWLRAGRELRYVPEMRVWHHDWRTPEQMRELYVHYGRGQGAFYAKHLRRRDLTVLRFLARDLRWTFDGAVRALGRGERWPSWVRGNVVGLPLGLIHGWRTFGRGRPGGGRGR